MSTRRSFLRFSMLTSALAATGKNLFGQTAQEATFKTLKDNPIVISTWDFGRHANQAAWKVLTHGGRAVDAVEAGVRVPEADPDIQSVGYGGRPDRDGRVTLDACIMDEHSKCGSVVFLEHIVHPVSVARKVMDESPHVLLAGEGALQFALQHGFKKENLLTEKSKKEWQDWLKESKYKPVKNIENTDQSHKDKPGNEKDHDTIGMVALDATGNMGGACTTSGMAYKLHGRVGDSPIIGAGLYVDNEVGAATATGVGEEVIRIVGAHLVVELMRMGASPEMACRKAVERIAQKNPAVASEVQVGFLALNKAGEYGAFSLQKGFSYSVKSGTQDIVLESKSLY